MDQLEILEEAIEENTEAIEAIEVTNRLHEELWVYDSKYNSFRLIFSKS